MCTQYVNTGCAEPEEKRKSAFYIGESAICLRPDRTMVGRSVPWSCLVDVVAAVVLLDRPGGRGGGGGGEGTSRGEEGRKHFDATCVSSHTHFHFPFAPILTLFGATEWKGRRKNNSLINTYEARAVAHAAVGLTSRMDFLFSRNRQE